MKHFYGKPKQKLRYVPICSSSMYVCDECHGMGGLPADVLHLEGCSNASREAFDPNDDKRRLARRGQS